MIRAAAAALAVLAIAGYLLLVHDPDGGLERHVHRGDPAFSVLYDGDLLRPRDGGLLTLAGSRKELEVLLTVTPLRLPEYEGDVAGLLPVHADNHARRIGLGGAQVTADRRARVHGAPGYELGFEPAPGARTTLLFLVPAGDPGARDGVLLRYDERQPPERDRGGGRRLALAGRAALRSLQFGAERY